MHIYNQHKNLIWGISTKKDGRMKFLKNQLDQETIKNRKAFFQKHNIKYNKTISANLCHGNNVTIVNKNHCGDTIKETDSLVSSTPNIYLSLTIADCLPIFYYDPVRHNYALVHAGWKGILNNIIENTNNKLISDLNSNPKDLKVYIGPHIQNCHFEIQENTISKFNEYNYATTKKDDKYLINLSQIVKEKLINHNIINNNIEISNECTHCLKNKYFSYRRDKPKHLEAMIAFIGIKND